MVLKTELFNRKMEKQEIIKKIEKVVWDWKSLHTEISDVLNALDKDSEEYKIVLEIANVESQLIEEAQARFEPLLRKLKEKLLS